MKTVWTREEVVALLNLRSPRNEALFLVLAEMGHASTAEIANALNWDRSNTGHRLEQLLSEARVVLVDEAYNDGAQGRPTRIWAARFA